MTDPRARLLATASDLVTGDRAAVYGEPAVNFARIAALQTVYLRLVAEARDAVELQPHDVAVLNILAKLARLVESPTHEDSWLDVAGYAATGFVTAKETP